MFLICPPFVKAPPFLTKPQKDGDLGRVRIALYSSSQHFQLPISYGIISVLSYREPNFISKQTYSRIAYLN